MNFFDSPANTLVDISYTSPQGEIAVREVYAENILTLHNGIMIITHEAKKVFIPWPRLILIEET